MTGQELTTFITGLNGDATINPTLLGTLVQTAQAIIEEERSWMVLRKTDTSKSVTTGSTWQTQIDLSSIIDFSRFYSEWPIVLFDGDNRTQAYRMVPFDRRLEYKNTSNTCCYDENAKILYLNGIVSYSGTLYIHYVSTPTQVDVTSSSAVWSPFPGRFVPLLGFYAVGVFKGAVDYDTVNRMMLPENANTMQAIKNAMEKWDTEKQMTTIDHNDPSEPYGGGSFRSGAINRDDE